MTQNLNTAQTCCGSSANLNLTDHIEALLDYERNNGLASISIKNLTSYLEQFNDHLAEHPVCCLKQVSTDLLRNYIIKRTEARSAAIYVTSSPQ